MRLGIIGLPQSGKTTVYNALTKGDAPIGRSMGGRFDILSTVVDVKDPRVDALEGLFKPRKTTYARIVYTAVDGLKKGAGQQGGLSGELLNHLAGLDGFVHVVRAFESELYPHPDGSVDAARDLAALDLEFLLNDLVIVERRIAKLEHGIPRGAFRNKALAQQELVLFGRLNDTLSAERPLRSLDLSDGEMKTLRGYGLLTLKPTIVLINIDEEQPEVTLAYEFPRTVTANLRGKLEMELAQLSASGDTEALDMFMEEYGVTELSLDRVIRLSYELMGLQSFFTVGEDEVRAWTIARGANAVAAASTIHSDLAKGFIRAETIHFEELLALGGLPAARSAGKLRQEGKTYPVRDGDVMSIKFNV